MSVLCFIIHSLDGEHTCWFSHFFESLITDKKDDDVNRNKKRVSTLIQRVHRDYKVQTATIEYHNETSFEGCILVNMDGEDLFVVYKQVQDFCFTMACNVECNRVLASYMLSQLVIQILTSITSSVNTLASFHIEAKEFLLRPEHVCSILYQLIPHGRLLLTGNTTHFANMNALFTIAKK